MVRNYKRKTATSYSRDDLLKALEDVRSKQLNSYQAAELYGIPRSTLIHRLRGSRGVKKSSPGRPTILSKEVEKKIAECIHVMEKCGFPLTTKEVKILVSDYIKRNGISTPFKNDVPGDDWCKGFKERHKLSLKKPQSLENARRKVCDPFVVNEYYELLEKILEELKLTEKPKRIYNLDETNFCNDPSKSKVMGKVGYRSTRTTSSPGRNNTTVLLAANALGEKIPPLIIYQGKHLWNEWMFENKGVKTAYATSRKGWMETSIFEKYIKDVFIPAIGTDRPVLLIFDGSSTHCDLSVIELAAKNGITILKLPAHSSHILQPSDCSTMKPMKDRWDYELLRWQRLHMGAKLPKKEFARILTSIWQDLNPVIVENGFVKTGTYPVHRKQITEKNFDAFAWSKWKCHLQQRSNQQKQSNQVRKISDAFPSLLNLALRIFNKINSDEYKGYKDEYYSTQHSVVENHDKERDRKQGNEIIFSLGKKETIGESLSKNSWETLKDPRTFKLNPMKIIDGTERSSKLKILKCEVIKPIENKENIIKPIVDIGKTLKVMEDNNRIIKQIDNNGTAIKSTENKEKLLENKEKTIKLTENKDDFKERTPFEELVLATIARNDPPKNPKKRVSNGAEILTYSDVINRMRKEKEDKESEKLRKEQKLQEKKNKMKSQKKASIQKKIEN